MTDKKFNESSDDDARPDRLDLSPDLYALERSNQLLSELQSIPPNDLKSIEQAKQSARSDGLTDADIKVATDAWKRSINGGASSQKKASKSKRGGGRRSVGDTTFENELREKFLRDCGARYKWLAVESQWIRTNAVGHWISANSAAMESMRKCAIDLIATLDASAKTRASNQLLHGHIVSRALTWARHALNISEGEQAVEFDTQPHLLGVRSGVVDLRTKQVRPAQAGEYIRTHLDYDAQVGATPHFDAIIDHATAGDTVLKDWLLRYLGYCLTAETREHVMLFVVGRGGTGKSTLSELIQFLMQSYGAQVESGHFVKRTHEPHSQWLANLEHKRFISMGELPKRSTWNTTKLNRIVSGESMTANRMRENDHIFRSTMKVLAHANSEPRFDSDDGFGRRVRLLRMDTKPSKVDTALLDKLKGERAAILAKLIDQASIYYRVGRLPVESSAMQLATRDYVNDQDTLSGWLNERCDRTVARNREIPVKALHADYKAWCDDNGYRSEYGGAYKFAEGLADERIDIVKPRGRQTLAYGIALVA